MKNVYEVLRQKELELARLEKEVEALRVAAPFLSDLTRLKAFDLVFIDCAAASAGGYTIDLGPQAALIEQNLRVTLGGAHRFRPSDHNAIYVANLMTQLSQFKILSLALQVTFVVPMAKVRASP